MDANGLRFWMLSQLNDWLPPWRALTAYLPGQSVIDPGGNIQVVQSVQGTGTSGPTQPAWQPSVRAITGDLQVTWVNLGPGKWAANTLMPVGRYIEDGNGNLQYSLAGTSRGQQPVWPTVSGQTIADGSVTWQCTGPASASQVASLNPWQPGTAYTVGQMIVDSNGNRESAIAVAASGVTGTTEPQWPATIGQMVIDGTMMWRCAGPSQNGLYYCNTNNTLELRSERAGPGPNEDYNTAKKAVEVTPMTLDQYGNYARWNASTGLVMAGGSAPAGGPSEVIIYAPGEPDVTDLAMGYDGVLYVAQGGSLVMIDRRNRWPNYTLAVPGFVFWRLAALPEGGVLALDRNNAQLGKVAGLPLQTGPVDAPDPGVMRPCQANSNPPRIVATCALPAGEKYVALAAMDPTAVPIQFGVMSWAQDSPANQVANVRIYNGIATSGTALQLSGIDFPFAIAWLGGQKLAVLCTNLGKSGAAQPDWSAMPGVTVLDGNLTWSCAGPANPTQTSMASWAANTQYVVGDSILDLNGNVQAVAAIANEAQIYNLSDAGTTLIPAGDTYMLSANDVGPFVHGFELPPNYANPSGANCIMSPLVPLSLNSRAARGATNPAGPAVIDSGISQCVWHRMYVEAIVPPRCGAVLWLTASDDQADLFDSTFPWYPHILGDADLSAISTAMLPGAPDAVWQSIPTEIPSAPTLLKAKPIQNLQGLFMVLVQRANKAVRNLSGRFLGVRIQLNGDGRNTPQIAGMRIYGPRFSYVQRYLPEIYREAKFPPASEVNGPGTRRDFLERYVNLFESQFTRIEDRIANAYLLMRPESAPDDALDWLGWWIGIQPGNYPKDQRRARLEATPSLYQWRGTAKAVTEALDVATGGACSNGAIIVIEDFRLRHIFATILGANLSDSTNPLLPGYSGSSNSFVGDALFLGDPRMQAELQALYQSNLNLPGGSQALQQFYDQLAYRMTVFVHNQVENVNLNLVKRVVEAEKPAHVQAFVTVATQAFMIGLASLVGVNTYLAPEPPRDQVTVGVSDVGRYDVVMEMPVLDPRMNGELNAAEYSKPVASIVATPKAVVEGGTIVLDGSGSVSPAGTTITQYRWTLLGPQK